MDTSRPAGRLFTMLELLQDRPGLAGPQLASRLGVSGRTVRRYVTALQDLGIPVEPTMGCSGGYRLRPGYRMPPLMLSTDEAIAIILALSSTRSQGRGHGDATPAATALTKLNRVLPRDTLSKVATVQAAVSTPSDFDSTRAGIPDPGLVGTLAEAVVRRRRLRIRHLADSGAETAREIDPYGVVAFYGGWYTYAWCHLRQGPRTFRLDRIASAASVSATFAVPSDLNVVAAVEESLALGRPEWAVTIIVHAPLSEVTPWVPRTFALLDAIDADTTRLRSSTRKLDYFVWRISDLPFSMSVSQPIELREAFRRHGQRMLAVAET